MSALSPLGRITAKLEAARIPYMIAGSFASTIHGHPRSTLDIDVVIDPSVGQLDAFVASLSADDYYADIDAARDALQRRSQFNVIDMGSAWKIDLILRKDRAFSVEEFVRRRPETMDGVKVMVATAEDTIVAKLEWAKLGSSSERQLRDVSGILEVRREALDLAYIERWVGALGLDAEWRRVRAD